MASQHEEDQIIKKYFGDFKGQFLDIGAWNGVTFSNTHELVKRGWGGVCVEPSPHAFVALQKLYKDHPNVKLLNAAVATTRQISVFYETDDALSSLSSAHRDKWKGYTPFSEMYLAPVTPVELLAAFPGPHHFVSIDTEGTSVNILGMMMSHLPLEKLGVRLLCIEAQGEEANRVAKLMNSHWKFRLVGKTVENMLWGV